ncbi:MAG: hypothetical protein ABH854_00145 [Candidatus Diapherotrites archaeon]
MDLTIPTEIAAAVLIFFIVSPAFTIAEHIGDIFDVQPADIGGDEGTAINIAGITVEGKVAKKLVDIYSYESKCTAAELKGHIGVLGMLSPVTGMDIRPVDLGGAGEIISDSGKCVPSIERSVSKKSGQVYTVSYLAVFPEKCPLPGKEIALEIESDLKSMRAETKKGKIPEPQRSTLNANLSAIDGFGNCKQEIIYKLVLDSGFLSRG